jgi:hypothetical protein
MSRNQPASARRSHIARRLYSAPRPTYKSRGCRLLILIDSCTNCGCKILEEEYRQISTLVDPIGPICRGLGAVASGSHGEPSDGTYPIESKISGGKQLPGVQNSAGD